MTLASYPRGCIAKRLYVEHSFHSESKAEIMKMDTEDYIDMLSARAIAASRHASNGHVLRSHPYRAARGVGLWSVAA